MLYVEMLVEKIFVKESTLSFAIREVNTAGQLNINNFKKVLRLMRIPPPLSVVAKMKAYNLVIG